MTLVVTPMSQCEGEGVTLVVTPMSQCPSGGRGALVATPMSQWGGRCGPCCHTHVLVMKAMFDAEEMRQQQRALRKTNRELERDRNALQRQEKQLVSRGSGFCEILIVN